MQIVGINYYYYLRYQASGNPFVTPLKSNCSTNSESERGNGVSLFAAHSYRSGKLSHF
jgi:hypothetical protein